MIVTDNHFLFNHWWKHLRTLTWAHTSTSEHNYTYTCTIFPLWIEPKEKARSYAENSNLYIQVLPQGS